LSQAIIFASQNLKVPLILFGCAALVSSVLFGTAALIRALAGVCFFLCSRKKMSEIHIRY
jgi:hypothetical protein